MPDWTPATPQQLPHVPAPVAPSGGGPRAPLRPGSADASRPWSRDGGEMTAAMAAETKPYLDAVMKMGSDFKLAHAEHLSPKMQSKLLKELDGQALPELPKDATTQQRREHEQAADLAMQDFDGAQNKAVHDATRALRESMKGVNTPEQFAAVKEQFETQYANLRQMAGRQEPSAMEMALPENSPLRTKLDPLTGGLRDPSTGLYANMTTIGEGAEQKNVIMFGGTTVGGSTGAQIVADAGQFMGGLPKAYQQAAQIVGEVQAELLKTDPDAKLETAGHSLGGGLANFAALSNDGVKATCFNAAALGGGAKAALGDRLNAAKEQVLHINVDGDLVGDGIGQARIPVQKASDAVGKKVDAVKQAGQDAAAFVADKADSAKQIGQMGVDAAKDRLAPVANFVADKADSAKQIGQMGVDAAKDRLAPAANFVADKADSAKQIGQMGVDAAKDRLAPAANFVADKADSAKQIGQMGVDAAKDRLAPVANFVADKADSAKQIGQMGVNSVKDRLAPAANFVADKADSARQIGQMGVDAAKDKAQKVGTSVRDMLRGPASAVSRQFNEVKQQVKDSSLGQKAGDLKDFAGKATKEAKNKAVSLYENLGVAQGKMAIPHQYGSCVTMENNGQGLAKNNPLKNHAAKAIDKAYAQNADRLAQATPAQNVRQNIKIGQRASGGGGKISV